MLLRSRPLLRALLLSLLACSLSACANLMLDPLRIDLVGLEPLPGQELEMRFSLKLRVQNPNDGAVDYDGVALELEVNGQPLASGVSDQQGQVPRFGEALISVPVSISAFAAIRQAWGAAGYQPGQGLPYALSGKLAGGLFRTMRFEDQGVLNWPEPPTAP
ncbi:LEA type 2 family protein [Pseudomonas benzenivorans]|uniref:LEA type 2 family protein n=1 Tax=Pseudomonas benzenivorans TaxID=556533 RepID=A0ABY5HBG6_9PSED|nr:LEA type 2 family protein [Pseudomonas benzenivorans]UTW09329.1 LEA type 2 family protein [Pseudomonas benzenivorans]